MSSTDPEQFKEAFDIGYARLCDDMGIADDPVEIEWMRPVAWAVLAPWRGEDVARAVQAVGLRTRPLTRSPSSVEQVHAKLLADRFFVLVASAVWGEESMSDDGELPANLDHVIADVLVANDLLGRPLKSLVERPTGTVCFEVEGSR